MSEMSCNVIRDLLPLYIDGALSDESCALVERHLAGCADCGKELARMREAVPAPRVGDLTLAEALLGVRRALKRTYVKAMIIGLAIVLALGFSGVAVWENLTTVGRLHTDAKDVLISDLCVTTSGNILFHASVTDGRLYTSQMTVLDHGVAYVSFTRPIIVKKEDAYSFDDSYWLSLGTIAHDGAYGYMTYNEETGGLDDWTEITEFRVGTKEDSILIWETGMELPVVDDSVDWLNYEFDNGTTG